MGSRGAIVVTALLLCTFQNVVCQDELYFDEWRNMTEADNYGGDMYVVPTGPRRGSLFGHHGERQARAWSVPMKGGDVDPDTTAPSPGGSRKGMPNRRFPAAGPGGRTVPMGQDRQSCPGGVCPNPDLFEDGAIGELDDILYDPTFPYDNCHYLGGFHDFKLNGTETCHLRVQGVNGHADRLTGGLDGLFLLAGCFEGKPLYIRSRHSGPPGEDRVLYFNPSFGAWEFSVGREPSTDQLVLAGDEGYVSPIDVPHWHLAAVFNSQVAAALPSDDEELYYVATGVSVMCADEGDDGLLLLSPGTAATAASGAGGLGGGSPSGGTRVAAVQNGGGGGGRGGGGGGAKGRAAGSGPGRGAGGQGSGRAVAGAGGEQRLGRSGRRVAVEEPEGKEVWFDEGLEEVEVVRVTEEDEEGDDMRGTRADGQTPLQPPPLPPSVRRPGGNGDGEGLSRGALEQEVREVREYWQRHEEEFYEMQYPYGEYPPEGLYDEVYGGPGEYDDGYGYGMY